MKREAGGPCLSALFVDYDNIYLSLKRKSEDAAKRFAKDAMSWLREIEGGRLITPTNAQFGSTPRRIVMNRCYGNPVPRRNQHDNSTDMNSFPFVRHHFLRAGFEVIDCPPLTAQLKNSADIRMVMDIRDLLMHDTYFDEFIILSGDADFTPVLIRLRAHARRTVIFANDFTAAPYTAISDGEIRESNLIELILAGELPAEGTDALPATPPKERVEDARRQILAEVVAGVRSSPAPVPLEALADRALRALGHEKTIATGWAGAGSFRELLLRGLPDEIRLTDEPPYLAFDARRHVEAPVERRALDIREPRAEIPAPPASRFAPAQLTAEPAPQYQPYVPTAPVVAPRAAPAAQHHLAEEPPLRPARRAAPAQREHTAPPAAEAPMPHARAATAQQLAPTHQAAQAPQRMEAAGGVQQSIARIQEACQAPPLAPPEYRAAVRDHGQGDHRQRPDRRADADQHHPAGAGARTGPAPGRCALRPGSGERGRSLVRAGRIRQSVCGQVPQLRGGALPRPGAHAVGRRTRSDRCLVRRRDAAAEHERSQGRAEDSGAGLSGACCPSSADARLRQPKSARRSAGGLSTTGARTQPSSAPRVKVRARTRRAMSSRGSCVRGCGGRGPVMRTAPSCAARNTDA